MKNKITKKRLQLAKIAGIIALLLLAMVFMSKEGVAKSDKKTDISIEVATPDDGKIYFKQPAIDVETPALIMTGVRKFSLTEVTTPKLIMTGTEPPGGKMGGVDKISLPTDPKAKKGIKAKPIVMTGVRNVVLIEKPPKGISPKKRQEYERGDKFEDEFEDDMMDPTGAQSGARR
jgi:hypothetical protein